MGGAGHRQRAGADEPARRTTDIAAVYAAADIVLCPSRSESFGRIAAEAMMNGLPVVASDIPAYRELIGEPGERGRKAVLRCHPAQVIPQLEAGYLGH